MFIGELMEELRRRFGPGNLVQPFSFAPYRIPAHSSSTPFLARGVAHLGGDLPEGDGGQETPQFVAAIEATEIAPPGPFAEALEDAESDIILILHTAMPFAESLAGQPCQPLEVALPEELRGRFIARFQILQPPGDGLIVGHNDWPARPGPMR